MNAGTGVFSRGGCGYGRVHVLNSDEASPLSVQTCLDDHPWNEQLRGGNFGDWIKAAEYGVRHALAQAEVEKGAWIIHRIVGTLADTTPTIVAVAAARAVWEALAVPMPSWLEDKLNQAVLDSDPCKQPSF